MRLLRVEVRRAGRVEAVHEVAGCAVDASGKVLASFGDVHMRTYLRSSAKPVQAEPLLTAWPDLDDDLIAIACASHLAATDHLDAVDRLLALSDSNEEDLLCGPDVGRPPGRRYNNCSGKHAGMLLACKQHGWSTHDYIDPKHPLQVAVLASLSDKMHLTADDIGIGVDGCGLPCHFMRLLDMARLYTQLDPHVSSAMRRFPALVGGEDIDDTSLMQHRPGWTAKRGAEGLLCVQTAEGIGMVMKGLDGQNRGLRVAMGAMMNHLGMARLPEWDVIEIRNTRGSVVGHTVLGQSL